jgi:hypothetical protein
VDTVALAGMVANIQADQAMVTVAQAVVNQYDCPAQSFWGLQNTPPEGGVCQVC